MTGRGLVMLALLAGGPALAAERRPSVLVILADDLRADAIGAAGNRQVRTPVIDGLAARGTVLERCYCMGGRQAAVCVPSRAMMLSGRSLFRTHEQLEGCDTWPEAFARAGYRTFLVGKWHNGVAAATRTFAAGRSVFLGGMHDPWQLPIVAFADHGRPTAPLVGETHATDLFAAAAVDFIGGLGDEPFFAWLALTAPHDPRQAPPGYRERFAGREPPPPANFLPAHPFDNGELKVRDEALLPTPRTPARISAALADYYACVEAVDAAVGRVLGALEARGRAADTIVVFASDNGLALGSHGLLGKQNLYEHSMRVPALLAGPGVPVGRRTTALAYLFDLMATVGALAGVEPPRDNEGRSLVPALADGAAGRDELLLAYRNVQRALVTPTWKLVDYPAAGRVQLFDLAADPEELHDRAADPAQAERRSALEARLAAAEETAGDPLARRPGGKKP